MKKKYFHASGKTALRLWVFATVYEELLHGPKNKEKTDELLQQVSLFANSNWVKFNASSEEKNDLNTLRNEIVKLSQTS